MREIRHYAWHYSPPTRKEFRGLLDRCGVKITKDGWREELKLI